MSDIWEWSTTADENNAAPPNGFPEDMTQASLNNAAREIMASWRRFYADPEWLQLCHGLTVSALTIDSVRIEAADKTTLFTPGVAVRLGGGAVFQFGFVTASSFTGGNTDVTIAITNEAPILAETDEIRVFFSHDARSAAFYSTGKEAGQIATNADLQTVAGRKGLYRRKTTADQTIAPPGATSLATQISFGGSVDTDYLAVPEADGTRDYLLSAFFPVRRTAQAGVFDWHLQVHLGATGIAGPPPSGDQVIYAYPLQAKGPDAYQVLPITKLFLENVQADRRVSFSLLRTSGNSTGVIVLGSGGATPLSFAYAHLVEHR